MVRIAFRDAVWEGEGGSRKRTKEGHVWLVINGLTYESTSKRGRAQGPKSFDWSTRTLSAHHCYSLGAAPHFAGVQMIHEIGGVIDSILHSA